MVEMQAVYQGRLHCELTHGPSGAKFSTDAPKDNMGLGEAFSPTDLMGAALMSCVLTTMDIVATRDGVNVNLKDMRAKVVKEMSANPRQVASLAMEIWMPKGVPKEHRARLEAVAHACPVRKSLAPTVQVPITFHYQD